MLRQSLQAPPEVAGQAHQPMPRKGQLKEDFGPRSPKWPKCHRFRIILEDFGPGRPDGSTYRHCSIEGNQTFRKGLLKA